MSSDSNSSNDSNEEAHSDQSEQAKQVRLLARVSKLEKAVESMAQQMRNLDDHLSDVRRIAAETREVTLRIMAGPCKRCHQHACPGGYECRAFYS